MNEQERTRLIEQIAENHLNELERANMLEQIERDPYAQQELIAEQAIARAVARDRQQLPIPSATPSPRLLDTLSTVPASSSSGVPFWGSSGFLVGVSLVAVIGAILLLSPTLFLSSQDALTTKPSIPPAIVVDSLHVNPTVTPVPSRSDDGKKREVPQSAATSTRTAESEGASADTTVPAMNRESGQPASNQEQKPPIPVVYDNDGTMPVFPK